jgi:hypothetical protein
MNREAFENTGFLTMVKEALFISEVRMESTRSSLLTRTESITAPFFSASG